MVRSLRALLFQLEPERAHGLALGLMRLVGLLPPLQGLLRALFRAPDHPVRAFGLDFRNPVGLAAGYDKDALGWRGLACLGFGHIEIGTVTLRPQPGNPRPRLFRLPKDLGLINRMGFPGRGAPFVARQLQGKRPSGLVLGVNLGINKETPLESAAQDYQELMEIFAPLADYLAINISSPNTIDLHRLQARQELEALLTNLAHTGRSLEAQTHRHVPLLIKLSPDLSEGELDDALDVIWSHGMDGVIAANTTLAREGLRSQLRAEAGGLSGAPLRDRSLQMAYHISQRMGEKLPLIGVGGIMNVEDAQTRLAAGAALVQLYTGLVYAGPGLVKQIIESFSSASGFSAGRGHGM